MKAFSTHGLGAFQSLLCISGQASVLILLIWLAQTIFRNNLAPRLRYAFWFLVTVRLVLPRSPANPLSIFNLACLRPLSNAEAASNQFPLLSLPQEPSGNPVTESR